MKATDENPDWPFEYPNDDLSRTMAQAARRAGHGGLDKTFTRAARVVGSRRQKSAVIIDNTHTKEATMPTVKTKQETAEKSAPAKRTNRRKASPVTTAVERTFQTDPKKAETPGTFRYKEEHDEPIIVSLYLRKDQTEKLFGQRPTGVKVTIEPIF